MNFFLIYCKYLKQLKIELIHCKCNFFIIMNLN